MICMGGWGRKIYRKYNIMIVVSEFTKENVAVLLILDFLSSQIEIACTAIEKSDPGFMLQ